MNIQNPILSELEALAPTLINVPKTLPYTIKDGYFDYLSNNILNRIKKENHFVASFFLHHDARIVTPYSIPDGYFANFANIVLAKLKMEEIEMFGSDIPTSTKNPYQLPTDYFNKLPDMILERVSLVYNDDYFFNESLNKITPYKVPSGYFNKLSNEILSKTENLNNANFGIGANLTKINPYKVPIGYFEGLSNKILLKIGSSKSQDIPEGYFASLPAIILQKIRGLEVKGELEQIAPILNTINKIPPNHIPLAYFETLQTPLLQSVPAKVIGMKKSVNWFKNAIAACLIGTLGFTAYQLMDSSTTTNVVFNPPIQSVVSKDLVPLGTPTSNINVDEELSRVDNASLAKYLDNIEMPTEQATAHFNEVNSGDVDEALQDISDETIQQHLDETGGLSIKKN